MLIKLIKIFDKTKYFIFLNMCIIIFILYFCPIKNYIYNNLLLNIINKLLYKICI